MPQPPQVTIVCSICSREKDKSKGALPARERYLGSHIKIAEAAAQKDGLLFFILSGKYGLLSAYEVVEYYDYLLKEGDVMRLALRLHGQLIRSPLHIEEIRFYTKTKPAWWPYRDALQQAAGKAKIKLQVIELPDDA